MGIVSAFRMCVDSNVGTVPLELSGLSCSAGLKILFEFRTWFSTLQKSIMACWKIPPKNGSLKKFKIFGDFPASHVWLPKGKVLDLELFLFPIWYQSPKISRDVQLPAPKSCMARQFASAVPSTVMDRKLYPKRESQLVRGYWALQCFKIMWMDTSTIWHSYSRCCIMVYPTTYRCSYQLVQNPVHPQYVESGGWNICLIVFSWQIQCFWANYNISLTWIKAIWGWFPLLTMISSEVAVRSL